MDINFSLLCMDVFVLYEDCRRAGMTRDEALSKIKIEYAQELLDVDERVDVLSGITVALCNNKELTCEFAKEIREEMNRCNSLGLSREYFKDLEQLLNDNSFYGAEATIKKRKIYRPDWKVGDVFYRIITYSKAKDFGISGWYMLVCKLGHSLDDFGRSIQLVVVALCPPEKLPQSVDELKSLGFIRLMNRQPFGYEYVAQIRFKSKKDEDGYGLIKLANFGDIELPEDNVNVNPIVATPMFGKLEKTDDKPAFEDTFCRYFVRNGIGKCFSSGK